MVQLARDVGGILGVEEASVVGLDMRAGGAGGWILGIDA